MKDFSTEDAYKSIELLMGNKEFLLRYGQYISIDGQLTLPKFQDYLATQIPKDNLASFTKSAIEQISKRLDFSTVSFFVLPITSMIPLPEGYIAQRINLRSGVGLSVSIVNAIQALGTGEARQYMQACFLLCGYYDGSSQENHTQQWEYIYSAIVSYANNFITAYKLTNHDHTIHEITELTQPSIVSHTVIDAKSKNKITMNHRAHFHDMADKFCKKLPHYKHQLENLRIYCEDLTIDTEVHYLLRLMIRSIDYFCLGSYEDCILSIDQFSEIAIKYIAKHMPCFTDKEVRTFEAIVHTEKPEKGLVNQIFIRTGWKHPDCYGEWVLARKTRNNIMHGLKFDEATLDNARRVLRSDLRMVSFFTKQAFEEEEIGYLLSLGEEMYNSYFEHSEEFSEYKAKAKTSSPTAISISYAPDQPNEGLNREQRRALKKQK